MSILSFDHDKYCDSVHHAPAFPSLNLIDQKITIEMNSK